MNRDDFMMLKNKIIYFDNAATALKPTILSKKISEYYNNYSANAHRGDYDISLKVDSEYEKTRKLVKEFINAKNESEIIFTSGTTDSLNKIVFGYFKNNLKENDEIIISKSEHASNVLPWFELKDELNLKIKYVELDSNLSVTVDNIKKVVNENTKVISLAYISNVVGDVRPVKEIIEFAHKNNILVVIDAAQAVAHKKINVQELDIDFLAFSAHKMYGPTGVGIIYAKESLLNNTKPTTFGGGMNVSFNSDTTRLYHDIPYLFEAGTQNIAGVIGLGCVIEYLNNVGIENIERHELELKKYAIEKLKEVKDIMILNEKIESGIITFNIKDIFAQDLAIYLNKYNICVRAGNHCTKILKEVINVKNTCRISFGLFNTFEEIDYLVSVLKNPKIKEEII